MQIRQGNQRLLTALALTALGAHASVENPVWTSTDPNVIEVVPHPDDPLKAYAVAQGEGEATVRFDADGHVGEGVHPIFATLDFTVIPADAETVELEVGDEEPVQVAEAA